MPCGNLADLDKIPSRSIVTLCGRETRLRAQKPEGARADVRRQQILSAAAKCFRDHGFHGASISQICKAAGMSAGHIYHYFENKEAIISEIVDQDLEHRLALTEAFRAAASSRSTLKAHIAGAVARQLDADAAALKVEIIAEAGRNPRVAEIIRKADEIGRAELAYAIRDIRVCAGHDDHPDTIDEMVELFSALYGGVLMRSITNPSVAPNALADRIVSVIEATLYG